MKIYFSSLTFKTLFLLFIASVMFILFILFAAKHSFSEGYIALVEEDISSIEESISPSIALNLSYELHDAIEEIANTQLKNEKVLLLEIKSLKPNKTLIFSNTDKSIKDLKKDGHFISITTLSDHLTTNDLGSLTLVYSNKSYETYMQDFYKWFGFGVSIFALAMMLLGYLLYNSLKNLTTLASSFDEFNPSTPKNFLFKTKTNDEIGRITKSANVMVEKLTNYITYNKELNETISQKELHLKDAQRIAKVGSWEYNIKDNIFYLSDEIYRILSVKFGTTVEWDDFLNFISKNDYIRVVNIFNNAIKNGSKFNIKYTLLLKNKNIIYVQTKGKVRKKQNGSIKITAVTMDITNDTKNKELIEKLAYYDALTGLANRTLLQDRMYKAIQIAKRENSSLAVIFLDLDHFKLINDTLGHSVGDELLIHISKILKYHIRKSDTLSRLGGDEFVILLPSVQSALNAHTIASKIQTALQNKHDISSHQLYITSSIGVAIYPEHGESSEELIRNADTAMYEAKNSGRNNYKIYSKDMGNYIQKQLHLEQDLIQAVKNKNEIEIFYQAKIDTQDNFISGAEALVRWNHPTKGLIQPDDFIHVAESTGLMIELGNIIIEKSIIQLQEWNRLGLVGLKIAINLSPRQFQDSELVSFIYIMIDKYQVNPSQIEFEITETLSMTNINNTLRILTELSNIGVSLAIDDFGTGYSSLAYLKKFPINTLKIDKSFVMDIIKDNDDRIIVQTIISMAHSLGFKTVAEGVETYEHVQILKEMQCTQLQGYYFSKPIPKNLFTEFLQNYKPNE